MDLQELGKVVESFDKTGLGRCLTILAALAEVGIAAGSSSSSAEISADDPLWTPRKAAEYMGISVQTLRVYRNRYQMESAMGKGTARRYRKSEIERVIALREGS